MQHHVFLSYSRRDTDMMHRVRDDLLANGLRVWTDEGIDPGSESWKLSIESALKDAGCLVAILSPDAAESRWVREELDFAEVHDRKVFLILARGEKSDSIPFGYSSHQWVDIRHDSQHDAEMGKLIHAVLEHIEDQTRTLMKPPNRATSEFLAVKVQPTQENEIELETYNIFNHIQMALWLFWQPNHITQARAQGKFDSVRQIATWLISALAFLPFLLPAMGYALGMLQTPDVPALPSTQLILAGIGFVLVYLINGWFGWRSGAWVALGLTLATTVLTVAIYQTLPGMSRVLFPFTNRLPGLLFMFTTAFSVGVAAGIASRFASAAVGTLVGIVIGAVINSAISNLQYGVEGSIAGIFAVVLALVVSAVLKQNIRSGKASFLSKALFLLLVANYMLMLWIYLLSGWSILTGT